MPVAYTAKAVANALLDLAEHSGKALNPMQIQKLVYFSHGWHWAIANRALIDERIEAWTYGPVVPSLYHEFKEFGSGPIKSRATTIEMALSPTTGRRTLLTFATPSIDDTGTEEDRALARGVIERVWQVYGSFTAVQLSQLTHEANGPWDKTRKANPGVRGADISDELIREDFLAKAKLNERSHGAATK